MSTTIDQRVVEMRFDNKQFESATRTTMSTLDKLKQKLNLTGASKGLEEINHAAKNNNMNILSSAVESAGKKFSALEVMGVTALVNITNQAVNAGKRLLSALTIEPVTTGFREYEMKMDSVRTIMASTGEDIKVVNDYLEELNRYSDQTIYSFADMTTNIGKFTNAGVKLEDAVLAIKGISNEAAVSGANANEASRAMYNFAQALSVGYIQRIDWKSIELANMATMEFKNILLETAIELGTVTKNAEGMYATFANPEKHYNAAAMFTETLDDQWLTTEVLISTLKDYADETTTIGKKAFAAAQEVTKFTQMLDVLKETAQSGWAKTWELMFGDLLQAKSIFTPLTNFFSNIINKMSDWRNKLIEGAMGSPLIGAYVKIIDELNGKAKTMKDALDTAANAMDNFGEIVDRVIGGEFGNGKERWDKLTEAGFNWAEVQNKVNEKLGSSVRHSTELSDAQGKLVKSEEEVKEARAKTIEQLVKMSDEELRALKLKPQEIKALRELEKQSEKTGIPVKDLAKDLSLLNGRSLLINSFKNIGDALVKTFTAMKLAWQDIFDPITSEHLYNAIAGFHKLTTHLKMNGDTVEKIRRTFKGLFAALDIVLTLTAGPLKIAFKALTSILKIFDLDILDVTASIGDAIVNFRDWIDEVVNFDAIFEFLAPMITSAAKAVRDWVDANIDLSKWLQKITDFIGPARDAIANWIEGLKNADDVQQYIIDTIVGAIKKVKDYIGIAFKNLGESLSKGMDDACEAMLLGWSSVPTDIAAGFEKGFLWGVASIIKNVKTFCTKFITTVTDIFQIHSPSRVMFEIGQFVIEGFINGVVSMYNGITSAVKNIFTSTRDGIGEVDFSKPFDAILSGIKGFGKKVAEVFGEIDFGKIFAAALGVGMLVTAKKAIDVLEMFGKPLEGFGDMLSGIGEAFEGFGKNLKASAFKKNAQALLIISGAIFVLVMAILPLTELSWEELGKAGASLVALTLVIAGLMLLMSAMEKLAGKDAGGSVKTTGKLILVAGSIFLLAFAVKKLSEIAIEGTVLDTIKLLASMVLSMAALMFAFGVFVKADKGQHMDKAGTMIFKMAAALLTMTTVIKIVSGFTYTDITKGLAFILGVGTLFALIVAVSKLAGEHANKAGAMMLKMSIAMLLMAGVVKIASGFSDEEIKRGLVFVAGVELLFAGLIAISHLSGKNAKKAGKMISSMGIAMLAMVFAIKIVSSMSDRDVIKGLGVVAAIMTLFAGVVAVSHFAGQHAIKAGIMLLAMSVALGVMVAITYIVSKLDPKEMWKALGFVTALVTMMGALIFITKYSNATKTLNSVLTKFLIIIALMVAAIVGLSFIEPNSLTRATGALMGVMGMFAVLMATTKYTKNTKQMRKSLTKMLAVVVILSLILAGLSKLDPDSALKASTSLSLLLLAFSSSILMLSKAGRVSKSAMSALKPMLTIAAGLAVIVAAFGILNKFGIESSIQSAAALSILLNAFASSIVVLGKAGRVSKSAMSALKPMLSIAIGLGAILAIFGVLSKFGMEPSIKSAAALSILLNAFAASIVVLGKAGSVSKTAMAAINPMLTIAAGMAGILAIFGVLGKFGMEPSIQSAIALGILLNAFASSIVILGMVGPDVYKAIPILQPMALLVAELAAILAAMSFLPSANIPSLIASAIALGILLNALAVSLVILGNASYISNNTITSAMLMGIVIGELAIVLGVMSALGVEASIPTAISLGILLNALATAMVILSFVGPGATAAIPAVLAMGVVVAELALLLTALGALAQIPGLSWFISEGGNLLQTIGTAIGQFVGGLVGGIAEGVAAVLPAIGSHLSAFMTNIQPFITGVQTVNESVLSGAGYLAGAILALSAADLIAGIASMAGLSFIDLGNQLTGFIIAAMPFLTSIQTIDPVAVEAAKTLAEMIIILTAAELLSGITSFIGGGTDFSTFGTQLEQFGSAVCVFSNTLKQNGGIDSESVEAAANAGKLIAGLQNELYGAGGLKQAIFGEKDLGVFGTQLKQFGEAICAFSNTLTQNGGIDEKAVESATRAGEAMAGLQNALYGAGGLKQAIFGEKDLGTFGTQLEQFGTAICNFSNTIKNNGGIDADAVSSAEAAGKTMAALQKEIESAGGLKAGIFGEKDLGDFGIQIKDFGQAMVDFSDIVAGNISEEAVTAASNAGRVMAEVQAAIPSDKWFDGKISLDDFGEKIVKFGEGVVNYSKKVADVDGTSMSVSFSAARQLVSLSKSVVDLDTSGISAFKDVKGIGTAIKDYHDKITKVDASKISSSISTVKTMVSTVKSMVGMDTSGISTFKDAISSLSKTNISDITKAFGGATTKMVKVGADIIGSLVKGISNKQGSVTTTVTKLVTAAHKAISSKSSIFNNVGKTLMTKFVTGLNSQGTKVKSTVTKSVASAVTGAREYYDSFYNAGSYLVSGFANGISENKYKAEAKAAAMASAAYEAAKEELDINSPSKVFRSLGYSVPEGFAMGIDRLSGMVKGSAVDMADTAINSVSKSIARISEAVNADMDTQPTIRPVLDLSNVRSGAAAISGLLNNQRSLSVATNAGTISTMMNHRVQNGANRDVVSAIDGLRKNLSNGGNTYYVIDGITYDDGSNIANAIETIVQSARIARRV